MTPTASHRRLLRHVRAIGRIAGQLLIVAVRFAAKDGGGFTALAPLLPLVWRAVEANGEATAGAEQARHIADPKRLAVLLQPFAQPDRAECGVEQVEKLLIRDLPPVLARAPNRAAPSAPANWASGWVATSQPNPCAR